MAEIQKKFSKPNIKEVRISGKEIDIQYLFTNHIDRIYSLGSRDVFNDITAFNSYEGAVENLLSSLVTSGDVQLNLDLEASNEFELNDLWDKISKVRDRFSICIKFMSRRGFWPIGDVESEPFILLDYIKKRVEKKLDALIAVEGDRGTGKSYTVLWLSKQLDKTFSLKRVFFNGEEFRRMLDKEVYPPGSVFVWDEATAGKGLNRRRSMSGENLDFNNILQVIRKRRYIVFFTMPNIDRVDSSSLEFFGGKITPVAIDAKNNICFIKFYQREGTGDNVRWTFIRTPTNHRITSIPIPNIELEDKNIVKDYELLKDEFLSDIISKKRKYKKGKKIPDIDKIVEAFIPLGDKLKSRKGNFKLSKIQTEYFKIHKEQLGRQIAEQVAELLTQNENQKKQGTDMDRGKAEEVGKPVQLSGEPGIKPEA